MPHKILQQYQDGHFSMKLDPNRMTTKDHSQLCRKDGGVGFYHKNLVNYNILHVHCNNLEAIIFNVQPMNYNLMVLYRPPSYQISLFKNNLASVINQFNKLSGGRIIVGDFSDNAIVSKSMQNFMQDQGYTQIVTSPTTENETILDHIYIKNMDTIMITI